MNTTKPETPERRFDKDTEDRIYQLLFRCVGERGDSEGAAEVLERLIAERDFLLVREISRFFPAKAAPTQTTPAPPAPEGVPDSSAPRRKYTRRSVKPTAKKELKGRRGGARNCKNCGKPGHLAKTCTESRTDSKLTDSEIGERVRELQAEGKGLLSIARVLRLAPKDVKKYWDRSISDLPDGEIDESSGVGEDDDIAAA